MLLAASAICFASCDKDEPKGTNNEGTTQDTTQIVEPVKCLEQKDIADFWIDSDNKTKGLKFVISNDLLLMNKLVIRDTLVKVGQSHNVALSCSHISISNAFGSNHQVIEEYNVTVEKPYLYLTSDTLTVKL